MIENIVSKIKEANEKYRVIIFLKLFVDDI